MDDAIITMQYITYVFVFCVTSISFFLSLSAKNLESVHGILMTLKTKMFLL